MTTTKRLAGSLIIVGLGLAGAALADTAKKAPPKNFGDPAKIAPEVYKLVLENDRVRVFDVRFKPGAKAAMHTHPDHVVYIVDDAKIRLSLPDGTSQDLDLKAGAAVFLPAGSHAAENLGTHDAHNLVVELKR